MRRAAALLSLLAIASSSEAQTRDRTRIATAVDSMVARALEGGRAAGMSVAVVRGRDTIDCTNLVVAPGFIDIHAHGQAPDSRRLQANDGVTTALELEIGVYPVSDWYASQEGTSLINYGATVSHLGARVKVKHGVDILRAVSFVSPDDVRRMARAGGLRRIVTLPLELDPKRLSGRSALFKTVASVYSALSKTPVFRTILVAAGPVFQSLFVKEIEK